LLKFELFIKKKLSSTSKLYLLAILKYLIIIYLQIMSFFTKLFGGEEKKDKTPPPPPPKSKTDEIAEKKIKIEAALNDLDVKIKSFE